MTPDLHKRLEEAAEQAGLKAFNNAYDHLETGEVCCLCQEIAYNNYRVGAELGYKEAIEVAKEWIAIKGVFNGNTCGDLRQYITNFETDMNKLLEDKK